MLDVGVTSSLFPIGPTLISMEVELAGGRTVEVALVGLRGAVGGIVSCGHAPAFARARVLVGGPAYRVSMEALEDAKSRSPFISNLFCRFSDYLLSQVMQSVACNAYHSIPERAARWLLHAQDRTGDRIELTQQALADLLGVQRTTVNAVIQSLERSGFSPLEPRNRPARAPQFEADHRRHRPPPVLPLSGGGTLWRWLAYPLHGEVRAGVGGPARPGSDGVLARGSFAWPEWRRQTRLAALNFSASGG